MTRLIAVFLCLFVLSGPVAAHAGTALRVQDEAEVKTALAHRFIAAIQTDQMSAMMGQIMSSLTPPRQGLTAAQNEALVDATSTTMDQMMTRLFDAMAPIYADIFTLEELTGLVNFYESDIGRSLMAKNYAATPRIAEVVQAMMPEVMRDLVDSMCERLSCSEADRARMNAAVERAGYGAAPSPTPPSAD